MVSMAIARRIFLFDLIPKNSIGAEIGVWHGQFSNQLIQRIEPKMLHLIDPWIWKKGFKGESFKGEKVKNQEVMDTMYKFVCDKYGSKPNVTIHRDYSESIYNKFKNDYFDWIYIDGLHSFEAVYNDMKNYYPKVKTGGIIIGDDFNIRGDRVKRAVNKFTEETSLKYKTKNGQFWFWKK